VRDISHAARGLHGRLAEASGCKIRASNAMAPRSQPVFSRTA
jgi:hypothetical protein